MTKKTLVLAETNRLPERTDLDSAVAMAEIRDDDGLDIAYMSKSFCCCGLPLRRQFERDKITRKAVEPAREISVFVRNDDRFSFTVNGRVIALPSEKHGGIQIPIGVPYGPRARLIILWLTTQSRMTGSRWLELGRIGDWLDSVGMSNHPDTAAQAKEQLIRLSFSLFTMAYVDKDKKQELFKDCTLIESRVFAQDDLAHYGAGEIAKLRFPVGIELTQQAFNHFTGPDVIPVGMDAIREISNNALAIDLYLYLNFLLPSIPGDSTVLLSWKKLVKQFGSGETVNRFRAVFDSSIEKALVAYRNADVRITDDGLELRYSPPAGSRRTLVAVPRLVLPDAGKPVRLRNRIAPPPGVDILTKSSKGSD